MIEPLRTARLACACLLLAGLTPRLSAADTSAQDRAAAEALFREGRQLFNEGKLALACSKLDESSRLDPALGTLLNLALCHAKQGRTASAWSEFLEAQEQARSAHDEQRQEFARQNAAQLELQLSQLRLSVHAADPQLTLTLDGRALGAGVWGSAIPVDPGAHRLVATAPEREPWSRIVTIGQGPTVLELEVPELAPAKTQSLLKATTTAPHAVKPSAASKSERPTSRSRASAYVVGGVGLAALGASAVFGLRALSKENVADQRCPDPACSDATGLDASSSARTSADIATTCAATGLVALAVGVWLFVRDDSPSHAAAASPRLSVGQRGRMSAVWSF